MKTLFDFLMNLLTQLTMSMYPLCQTQPVRLPVEAPAPRAAVTEQPPMHTSPQPH